MSDPLLPCILPSLVLISAEHTQGKYKMPFQYVTQFMSLYT